MTREPARASRHRFGTSLVVLRYTAARPSRCGWLGCRPHEECLVQIDHRIAFFTLGVLKAPCGNPLVQGFVDRLAEVYAAAEGSAGFFDRSVRDLQTWEHSWGPVIAPTCIPSGTALARLAMTLSLWSDLESVAAFAYHGVHREALSRRADWVETGPWPSYVAWWVDGQHRPNWSEAVNRIDHLHAHGPTPMAFSFRQPFDVMGAPVRMKARPVTERPEA